MDQTEGEATSFPGSLTLFFPPLSLVLGGGKKRDPGNEVEGEAHSTNVSQYGPNKLLQ